MRRAMARRLTEAALVPCFYLRRTADVTGVFAERARLREAGAGGVPSINDYILHACAKALRAHPVVNASWGDNEVLLHPRVNVGVAIAIPGGLVVPAIYDADRLEPAAIAATSRALAESAAARRLSREGSATPPSPCPIWGCSGSRTSIPSSTRPRRRSSGSAPRPRRPTAGASCG